MLREILASDDLRDYDYRLGRTQPAQRVLGEARARLASRFQPLGYLAKVSGSAVNIPRAPWIALLDKSVTTTAKSGIYVVYLFDPTLERAYLSLNQGVTAHIEHWRKLGVRPSPRAAALTSLSREAELLRRHIDMSGLISEIQLGGGELAEAYAAGNVAAISYELSTVPDESTLEGDLQRLLRLYEDVVPLRTELMGINPEAFVSPSQNDRAAASSARGSEFRPKSASDYRVFSQAHDQVRTRKHEAVVAAFGSYVRERGWVANTRVHPRDLVIESPDGRHVLCEIKMVGSNAEFAVRETIGQLLTYREFLYSDETRPSVSLLAVFSADVGALFAAFLDSLGIASVWPDSVGGWEGSHGAANQGLPVGDPRR